MFFQLTAVLKNKKKPGEASAPLGLGRTISVCHTDSKGALPRVTEHMVCSTASLLSLLLVALLSDWQALTFTSLSKSTQQRFRSSCAAKHNPTIPAGNCSKTPSCLLSRAGSQDQLTKAADFPNKPASPGMTDGKNSEKADDRRHHGWHPAHRGRKLTPRKTSAQPLLSSRCPRLSFWKLARSVRMLRLPLLSPCASSGAHDAKGGLFKSVRSVYSLPREQHLRGACAGRLLRFQNID